MDSNRDESERCIELALDLIKSNDKEKALKYLIKAERLFPSPKAKELIEKITNECNNTRTSHSNSDYNEKNKTSDDYESEQQEEYNNSEESKFNGYNENTENTSSGFNTNINSNSNTKTKTTNRSNTNTYSKCSTKEYTEEQLIAVKQIKKCKDYYEILGVSKETVDTDIKKQYRKLALQFHPDKNKAPGAAEAFKAIGNAFAILSDVEKRKQYDLYGSEEQQRRRSHNSYYDNGYDYTRGFEGDVSADEIFNMFFGGGFPSGNVYVRRGNRWRETTRHQNHNQNQEVASGYNVLLQMMPVLVLLCLSLMSTFFVSDPAYSLSRTHKYSYERKTNNLEVPYFVKDNFERDYKGNIRRVEQQVEEDYLNNLRASCFRERNYKESMIWRARNFRDRELEERAKGLKTPSCDNLQKISSQYVIW